MPKNPQEPNQVRPQDSEFAEEMNPTPQQPNQMEQKDARGGNHNPEGANQYTSGRHDDRGRKEAVEHETKGAEQHNGQAHANQYTQGRNDDRGRKE